MRLSYLWTKCFSSVACKILSFNIVTFICFWFLLYSVHMFELILFGSSLGFWMFICMPFYQTWEILDSISSNNLSAPFALLESKSIPKVCMLLVPFVDIPQFPGICSLFFNLFLSVPQIISSLSYLQVC